MDYDPYEFDYELDENDECDEKYPSSSSASASASASCSSAYTPFSASSAYAVDDEDLDLDDDDELLFDAQTKWEEVQLLQQEIEHMMEHGIQPPVDWFESRIRSVHTYSDTDWLTLAATFAGKDDYVTESCQQIHRDLYELVEDWSISPVFNLSTYYHLMQVMAEFLPYYQAHYVDEHLDEDVSELMASFRHL